MYLHFLLGYYNPDLTHRDSLIQGYCHKLGGMSLLHQWQRKFLMLYPNRLEWSDSIVVSLSYMEGMYMYIAH